MKTRAGPKYLVNDCSLVPQISAQTDNCDSFGPNLPEKVFLAENRESEYHHGILHI